MRIRHTSCHKESEILVKIDSGITKLDLHASSISSDYLLHKNRINRWVDLLLQIFNKAWSSIAYCSSDFC